MSELKPCPFCGSEDVHIDVAVPRYGLLYYAVCDCCGARSKSFGVVNQSESTAQTKAKLAWNRRAEENN